MGSSMGFHFLTTRIPLNTLSNKTSVNRSVIVVRYACQCFTNGRTVGWMTMPW